MQGKTRDKGCKECGDEVWPPGDQRRLPYMWYKGVSDWQWRGEVAVVGEAQGLTDRIITVGGPLDDEVYMMVRVSTAPLAEHESLRPGVG